MGVTFDRWLAKPSTACLLRRMIQCDTGRAVRHSGYWQRRRQHIGATMRGQKKKEAAEPEDESTFKPSYFLYGNRRAAGSMRGLYMSLRAGTPLLRSDTEAKDASSAADIQIDVGSADRLGQLLVDEPEYKHDMALWAEILQMRHRLHGREGLGAVWTGMRERGVDLPIQGEHADLFWTTFINSAIDDGKQPDTAGDALLLDSIFDYANNFRERTRQQYPSLYKVVVGRLLRVAPHLARMWHFRLVKDEYATSDDIVHVIPDLVQDAEPEILREQRKFFRQVYKQATRRDLYDEVISQALTSAPMHTALHFHQVLLANGDAPSQGFFRTEGVQRLFKLDRDGSLPMKTKSSAMLAAARASQDDLQHALVNRETMNTLVGDVHGIKPKEFSDAFCARMFATRAFSTEWVIRGLALFGVDKLGPLAMREMAVRAGTLENLQRDLEMLRDTGITCNDSMFSHVLHRVAKDDNSELWQALLQSDQHPEAWDDPRTQNSMLVYSLEQENWVQVHIGLLVAALAGNHASTRAWNRVLQYYLMKREYSAIVSTLQFMKSQQVALTLYTTDLLKPCILPQRDVSKRPYKGHGPGIFEPTAFVAKAYLYAARNGTHPRPAHWVEILKRLGMDHNWAYLERVVLTHLDRARISAIDDGVFEEEEHRVERLKHVFTSNMRKALFVWSFRSAAVRNLLREPTARERDLHSNAGNNSSKESPTVEHWAKGLSLLQRLRDFGFDFPVDEVRVVFVQRMWILFGPGYSTRALNHEARRVNRLSLAHYVKHANEVWNGLIDWVDPELLEYENDPRLLQAFFREYRMTSERRGEVADVKAWSEALASGTSFIVEPKRTRDKEAVWMQSPLRIQTFRPLLSSNAQATSTASASQDSPTRQACRQPQRQLEDKG